MYCVLETKSQRHAMVEWIGEQGRTKEAFIQRWQCMNKITPRRQLEKCKSSGSSKLLGHIRLLVNSLIVSSSSA